MKKLALMLMLASATTLFACNDDKDSDECQSDALRCTDNGTPEKCVDGNWVAQTACSDNTTCNHGVCTENTTGEGGSGTGEGGSGSGTGENQTTPDPFCKDKGKETAYLCDGNDYVVCTDGALDSRSTCAKDEGESYSGNICVVDNISGQDMGHCGCNADTDCKSGYACNTTWMVCEEIKACSPDACKAMKGDDYLGNACIEIFDVSACGCNDNKDCNSGYECNAYGVCTPASAQPPAGDTGDCDPVACKNTPIDEYYIGDICVDYYGDGNFECGCLTDADCSNDTTCTIFEGDSAGYCF